MAGFLTAAGNLLGSYLDFRSNERNNMNNWNMQHETNMMNAQMNQENIEFQKLENEIARSREDNAVQRRAADLMGAGLSKTLAAGSPASANAMQAPQNTFSMNAPKFQAYQGFETAANHVKQNMIADRELDLRDKEIDVSLQKLDEEKRHNEANEEHDRLVREENERFHNLQDKWKFFELHQDSKFHDDAMKLSWAQTQIDYLSYLNDVDKTEIQNMWYSGQLELQKAAGERDSKRLTAELAESVAKTAMYLKDIKLSDAQIRLLEKEGKLMYTEAMRNAAQARNLNAQTVSIIVDKWSKAWNLFLSVKHGSKTTNPDVSPSQAMENSLDRKSSLRRTLITAGAGAVGVALGAFGIGAKGLLRKAFGEDRFDISYSVK